MGCSLPILLENYNEKREWFKGKGDNFRLNILYYFN